RGGDPPGRHGGRSHHLRDAGPGGWPRPRDLARRLDPIQRQIFRGPLDRGLRPPEPRAAPPRPPGPGVFGRRAEPPPPTVQPASFVRAVEPARPALAPALAI